MESEGFVSRNNDYQHKPIEQLSRPRRTTTDDQRLGKVDYDSNSRSNMEQCRKSEEEDDVLIPPIRYYSPIACCCAQTLAGFAAVCAKARRS